MMKNFQFQNTVQLINAYLKLKNVLKPSLSILDILTLKMSK